MLWTRETVTSLDNQRKATAFSLMYVLFLVVSGVIREQKQSHISGVIFNLILLRSAMHQTIIFQDMSENKTICIWSML
jgi:hypothetical protein